MSPLTGPIDIGSTECGAMDHTCRWVSEWTGNTTLGWLAEWFLGVPLTVATLIVVGVLARWLLHRAIQRVVRRAKSGMLPSRLAHNGLSRVDAADASVSTRRAQRVKAMGSLLESVVSGVIFAVVVVMILSALGFDVAPVIASAGIVGVALGFGSQTLVKDFLSGIFMIFEDQYGVGDMVDVGEATGTVEAVSLRVTRIRDVNGTVWYVRNGEILRVGNMSQNWAGIVLDIPVSYDADLAKVKAVLTQVATDAWTDPELEGRLIEPPEVRGVQSLGSTSVTVQMALKTPPLEQNNVAREIRQRIKARFDHEGIKAPQLPQLPTDPSPPHPTN